MNRSLFKAIPWLANYMDGADHIDVRSVEGSWGLREFVAGFFAYEPAWMRALWKVRGRLLKLLNQGDRDYGAKQSLTPETLPVKPGEKAMFFTVADSDDATYWVASSEESHLGAAIGVVSEPLSDGRKRFHVITVVRYRNWAGPIYFNMIRPFHHAVVYAAMKNLSSSEAG